MSGNALEDRSRGDALAESAEQRLQRERQWVGPVTALLDTRFRIPFTDIRFGIDPILGLLPVAGDLVSAIITAVLIIVYVRLGIPNRIAVRMVANLLIDLIIGSIPVLGSVFDVVFKANWKNKQLANAYFAKAGNP
jgi:hypothetical protein